MRDYPPQTLGLAECAKSPMQESNRERLERQKAFMVSQIADIDEALGLLEKYPEIEKLQDLLRRI